MSARRPRWLLLWLWLSLLLLGAAPGPRPSAAFYLPGLAPVNFCEEEKKSDECKVGAARRASGARRKGRPRSAGAAGKEGA